MAAPVITVIKADRIMEVFHRRREMEAGLWKAPRRGKCAPPRATLTRSVDVRNETPGTRPIGVVFGAEALAQQSLLRLDASEHNNQHQHGDKKPPAGSERQPPAERQDEETKIARVANESVKPAGHQSVSGLNRNQAAEPSPEHKHRREAKNATAFIKKKTEPASCFATESEEIDPVCIGREIGV